MINAIIKITKGRNYNFTFILVVLIWLFNAFFNMFYTYFCSMLCYPIILLLIRDGKRNFAFKNERENEC